MSELELLQELERNFLRFLDLGQGLSYSFVVLALVVDRVWQDQAKVQLRLGCIGGDGCLWTLQIVNDQQMKNFKKNLNVLVEIHKTS